MKLCIVPMKPLADAKQRLAGSMSAGERRALSLAMLDDVVRATTTVGPVWVLNSDADAAAVATARGATPRDDPAPGAGLNPSLAAATAHALDAGYSGVLIVPADVPAITPADLDEMSSAPGVALAPDRSGSGTNALWRSPCDAIDVTFGPGSAARHAEAARVAGFDPRVIRSERLQLDVDGPGDLDVAAVIGGEATRTLLRSLGYPSRGRR